MYALTLMYFMHFSKHQRRHCAHFKNNLRTTTIGPEQPFFWKYDEILKKIVNSFLTPPSHQLWTPNISILSELAVWEQWWRTQMPQCPDDIEPIDRRQKEQCPLQRYPYLYDLNLMDFSFNAKLTLRNTSRPHYPQSQGAGKQYRTVWATVVQKYGTCKVIK